MHTTITRPDVPPAVLDDDNDLVTIAVTLRWRRPWAMTKCEVGALVGDLQRTLCDRYADWEQLAGLESVLTWDPTEEHLIGRHASSRPILFPTLEPELTDRDRELDQAHRDLSACIHTATYAAHGGDYGSLPMMADAARGIIDALQVIEPHRDGDSFEFTAISRRMALQSALGRSLRSYCWTADSLNAACSSALRVTHGWDNQRQEWTDR